MDLLTKPEDTGEIPRPDAVGEGTRNLAPYIGLPPALRRPTASLPIYVPGGAITGDLVRPGQPKPPPLPKPKVDDEVTESAVAEELGLGVYRENRSVLYVLPAERRSDLGGRHRRPRRFEPLWSALESGLACVRRAM